MCDVKVIGKAQLGNAFKALLQVRLHASGVLGLRQDLKHLVVGEEEEAREVETFLLQVVVETLWVGV